MSAFLKFLAVALGEWLIGTLATEVLRQSVADPTLRDWALVLIWPTLIVAGTIVFVAWVWRSRPAEPAGTTAVSASQGGEVSAANAGEADELDSYRRREAMQQRQMMASAFRDMSNEARGIRADHEQPSNTFHGRQGAPEAWARTDAWSTKVGRLLARDFPDEPNLFRDFTAPVEPIVMNDPDWRQNFARFCEVKAKRLDDIADQLHHP